MVCGSSFVGLVFPTGDVVVAVDLGVGLGSVEVFTVQARVLAPAVTSRGGRDRYLGGCITLYRVAYYVLQDL